MVNTTRKNPFSDEFTKELIKMAERGTVQDDENTFVDEYCGGNVDDAHALGERDGETNLARTILDLFDIDYTL